MRRPDPQHRPTGDLPAADVGIGPVAGVMGAGAVIAQKQTGAAGNIFYANSGEG